MQQPIFYSNYKWSITKNCESVYYTSVTYLIREGNGTSLQYSYLENPMDGGAWWAAV